MRQSFRRPSAAIVVACIALIVALGGTSYATVLQVPRNSVGPPQLKRNAVGPTKIAPNAVRSGHVLDGTLLVGDFRPGQIPQGPKGEKGEKGDRGIAGAPGIADVELVRDSSPASSFSPKNITVRCPAGKWAIGGGTQVTGLNYERIALTHDLPIQSIEGPIGWSGGASEVIPNDANWVITAVAICAKVS